MIALAPNVYYPEAELLEGLKVSKKWLRRTVGFAWQDSARVYLGADVAAAMTPARKWAAPAKSGWAGVYFVACDECGLVKIGESGDIRARLRGLIQSHPHKHVLRLLGFIALPDPGQRREREGALQ